MTQLLVGSEFEIRHTGCAGPLPRSAPANVRLRRALRNPQAALRALGYAHATRIGRVLPQGEAMEPISLVV